MLETRFQIFEPVGDGVPIVTAGRDVQQLPLGDDRGDLADRKQRDNLAPPDRNALEIGQTRLGLEGRDGTLDALGLQLPRVCPLEPVVRPGQGLATVAGSPA